MAATATAPRHTKGGQPKGKTNKSKGMTDDHKRKLREGREQGRAVRDYLSAIEPKPRGRRLSRDELQEKLTQVESELAAGNLDRAKEVELIQRRNTLQHRLGNYQVDTSLEDLEKAFIKSAKPWAEAKGIQYAAFREIGVPKRVLDQAGIKR